MSTSTKHQLWLAGLGALFFLPFLGGVHLFDWDEINFAECSREMLLTKDYLRVYINFEPFWEKPPLYFWLQALSMAMFGVGEYAARFPNAICGILTLVLLYRIGRFLHHSDRFGIIWALAYLGSVLPHLYFKSGIIDPWFNLWIFLGVVAFVYFVWAKNKVKSIELHLPRRAITYLIVAGLFIGLGILTKGPVAYLIAALTGVIYWVTVKFRWYVSLPNFVLFTLVSLGVMGIWYGLETLYHGPWFVIEFTKYQYRLFSTPDAGHGGFPGYHVVVLLFGCFPASLFAIHGMLLKQKDEKEHLRDFKKWMTILFWVVLVLFSVVQSKIVHYSSMCYFPLTYLAALSIKQLIESSAKVPWGIRFGLVFVTAVVLVGTIAFPLVAMNPDWIIPYLKDPFAVASLGADVNWTGFEGLVGVLLAVAVTLALLAFRKRANLRGLMILSIGSTLFISLALIAFIKRVEGYSQRASIEFFESLEGGEVEYIKPAGYKSYAHLFYSQKPYKPFIEQVVYDKARGTGDFQYWKTADERLEGILGTWSLDHDAYFVTKVHKVERFDPYPMIQEIGRKNGFVFFKREAGSTLPAVEE